MLLLLFCIAGQLCAQRMTPDSLLLCTADPDFSHFDDVQIFQFLGSDSAKGKITYSEKHDSLGRVVAYNYTGHKENSATGTSDVLGIKEYNKVGKLSVLTSYYNESSMKGEVTKTFYYYSDTILIAMERYSFEKRIRSDVDKGEGRPGGCIILPGDYEKERTWKLEQQVKYERNNVTNTSSYSTVSNTSQNGWEYTYDEKGRMATKQSMDGNRIVYTEYFTYKGDTVFSDLVWNNSEWSGTKRAKVYSGKTKKIVAEFITQGDKTWIKRYWYDDKDRITRYQYYNVDGSINLTHTYRYKD